MVRALRWSLPGCAALAVALGCGNAPAAHRPGEEWLESIRIEGNRSISDDELVPGLALTRTRQEGGSLDPYQLTVDTQRIRAAYLRRGWFAVDVKARVDQLATAQTAVFTIVEGKRSTIQVVFLGLPTDVAVANARALVALDDGAPFDYGPYDAAKEPLLLLLQDAGYAHAKIDAAVLADRATGIATARFAIDPGPRATFGPITVVGIEGDLKDAILGRLGFSEGDAYSQTALSESREAITGLQRFSSVRVDPDATSGAVVPVRIVVALGPRHELRVGGGAGRDPLSYELRLRFGGSYIGEHFPLWSVSGEYRPALTFQGWFTDRQQKHRLVATVQRLELFVPHVRGEIEVGLDYLTTEAYTSVGPRGRLGLSGPLGALVGAPRWAPWLTGRVGWVIEYLDFRDQKVYAEALRELRLDRPQRRGAYEQAIVADLRDDEIEPHFGLYAELRASEGTALAGGTLGYLQLTPELRGYVPLGARLVLAARLRVGAIFGDVPVTERYFSGGATSQRGFSERRLSPSVIGDGREGPGPVVIGGAGLLETGVELRIPLGEIWDYPFGTELFLDGADVTLAPRDLHPSHLHWAAGVGGWLKVGGKVKLRVDVGYRLNRHGFGEPEYETDTLKNINFHFGIGDTY